jgi:hypothetical protein
MGMGRGTGMGTGTGKKGTAAFDAARIISDFLLPLPLPLPLPMPLSLVFRLLHSDLFANQGFRPPLGCYNSS